MSDKEKPPIRHEVTTVLYKIGKSEPREGLIKYHREGPQDDSEEARIAALIATASTEADDPRARLFDLIKSMEDVTSALRQAEEDAGAKPEQHTLLGHIERVAQRLSSIRSDVQRFEGSCSDNALRGIFYEAMEGCLSVAPEVQQLTLKRRELPILRGRDDSYNHKGAKPQVRRQAVHRVDELKAEGEKHSDAVKLVAEKKKVTPQAVYGWIREQEKPNSGVVLTKTVVQDSD